MLNIGQDVDKMQDAGQDDGDRMLNADTAEDAGSYAERWKLLGVPDVGLCTSF